MNIDERNKIILALSGQINKFLTDIRAQHQTPLDIDMDVLLFSAFQSVANLLKSNLIPKEVMENYFMTVVNEYLANSSLNLYVGRYAEKPKPRIDTLN